MSDGNEGLATELAALRLAVAVAENYARNGSAESLHRTLCEALSAARESALREAASMVDGVANTRQHVEDRIDAILREDARILAQRIRALLEPPPPPKGTP